MTPTPEELKAYIEAGERETTPNVAKWCRNALEDALGQALRWDAVKRDVTDALFRR